FNGNGSFFIEGGMHPPNRRGIDTAIGLPDLLVGTTTGAGGTTLITYRLVRDFANAVRTDWPDLCYAWENSTISTRYISDAAACGQINGRPRPLVGGITKIFNIARNGRVFSTRTSFDYTNARVYGGPPSQRADLGFSEIKRTNLDTGAYSVALYRQD